MQMHLVWTCRVRCAVRQQGENVHQAVGELRRKYWKGDQASDPLMSYQGTAEPRRVVQRRLAPAFPSLNTQIPNVLL